MEVVCLICGKRDQLRRDVESLRMLALAAWGYDPVEGGVVYWACKDHLSDFKKIMNTIAEKRERAHRELQLARQEVIEGLKRSVFERATKLFEEEVHKLRDGEGLILWVSDGGLKFQDEEVKDVAVAVVKTGNELRTVYGNTKPFVSYRKEAPYSSTHYVAQDLDVLLHEKRDIKWRAIVQGLYVEGEDVARLVRGIFMATHRNPRASLVDILSNPGYDPSADDIRSVVAKARVVCRELYDLVETHSIEKRIAESIERKYGIPLAVIKPADVKRFIEQKRLGKKHEAEGVAHRHTVSSSSL